MKNLNTLFLALILLLTIRMYSQSLIIKQDEKTELLGLADENDNWIIKAKYKEIDYSFGTKDNGIYYVKDASEKIGFINSKGIEVVKCQFDNYNLEDGYYFVEKKTSEDESTYGVIDSTGKEIVPAKYGYITNTAKEGGFVLQDKTSYHYGVIDTKGKIIIPFTHPFLGGIYKGIVVANEFNPGLQGLLDKTNKLVLPYSYNHIGQFSPTNDIAAVAKDGKTGFINLTGKLVIPLEYEYDETLDATLYYSQFYNGYACVKKNGKWGVIDAANKVVIPFKYDEVTSHEGTKYTFKINNSTVTVDAKGK